MNPQDDLHPSLEPHRRQRSRPPLQIDSIEGSDAVDDAVHAASKRAAYTAAERYAFKKILIEIEAELDRPSPNEQRIDELYFGSIAGKIMPLPWSAYWPFLRKLLFSPHFRPFGTIVMLWRLDSRAAEIAAPILPVPSDLWKILLPVWAYSWARELIEKYDNCETEEERTTAFAAIESHIGQFPAKFPADQLEKYPGDFFPILQLGEGPITEAGTAAVKLMSELPQAALVFDPDENEATGWWQLNAFAMILGSFDPRTISALGSFAFYLPGREDALQP